MAQRVLQRVGLGKQASLAGGTVAASATLMGVYSATFAEDRTIDQPEELRGSFAKYFRGDTLGKVGNVSIDATLSYEDAPYYFGMAFKGGVSGVSDAGATPTYSYTYTPTLTSQDNPDHYSLELVEGTDSHRMPGAFARSIEISAAIRERTHVKVDIGGQYLTPGITATAGTADDSRTVEDALGQRWKLYADPVSGTIGTTQYSGCIVSLNWKHNGYMEDMCLDGNDYFSRVHQMPLAPELEMVVEVDTSSTALRANWVAGDRKLFRLENLGGTIHSGTPNATRTKAIIIDGAYRILEYGEIGGSDQDGFNTVRIRARGEYDDTFAGVSKVVVRNALSAPA